MAVHRGADAATSNSRSQTRVRTGCLTCRARHLKCDEQRPTCQRCLRGRHSCEYATRLVWEDDARTLGICHGRAGVWSRHVQCPKAAPGRSMATNCAKDRAMKAPYDARVDLSGDVRARTNTYDLGSASLISPQGPSPSSSSLLEQDAAIGAISTASFEQTLGSHRLVLPLPAGYRSTAEEAALFSYYQTVICDASSLINNRKHNGPRFQILPMAFESEAVYHGILMLAAKGRRHRTSSYDLVSLEYQQSAINGLIKILGQIKHSKTAFEEALNLVILLCACDIWDGNRAAWVKHFFCYLDLRRLGLSGRSTATNIHRYFDKFFMFHLVMAKTAFNLEDDLLASHQDACSPQNDYQQNLHSLAQPGDYRKVNLNEWMSTEYLALGVILEGLEYVDPYMGFSHTLLFLINDIASLRQEFAPSRLSDSGALTETSLGARYVLFQSKFHRFKATLEHLHQILPPSFISSESVAEGDRRPTIERILLTTSRAYKYASLVLLLETAIIVTRAYSLASKSPLDEAFSRTEYEQLRDDYVAKTIHSVTEVVNSTDIPLTTSWPLWPLFISGCCAKGENERYAVMELFGRVIQETPFGNVVMAKKVVETVWQETGLGRQGEFDGEHCQRSDLIPMYDWEHVICRTGWKISLA